MVIGDPFEHESDFPLYEDPNFFAPLPDQVSGAEAGLKEGLNFALFEAIEKTLIETDLYSTPSALAVQLNYAGVLAKIGYPERSEAHFRKALNQIELGRASLLNGGLNDELVLVAPTRFTRDQALWYARSAKAMADAGFTELAEETLARSQDALEISLGVDDDQISEHDWGEHLGRNIRESNASIDIISILTELGQYDTALELLGSTSPTLSNFPKFLAVMNSAVKHYEESDDLVRAQAYKDGIAGLLEEIKLLVESTFNELGYEHGIFGLPRVEITQLVESAREYGVDLDFADIFLALRQTVDRGEDEVDFIRDYTNYCWLAELHYAAGETDTAFQLLQSIIASQYRYALDNPNKAQDREWAFEAIARTFAYIGALEQSEALRENLPKDMQSYILHEELKYATGQEDARLVHEVAARLEENLSERIKESEVKQDPELINYIGIDLLLAYGDSGDYASVSRWFDNFIEPQEQGTLGEIREEKTDKLVGILYSHSRLSQVFMLLEVTSNGEFGRFMVKLLEDVNLNKSWEHDFDDLHHISERVKQYIEEFQTE